MGELPPRCDMFVTTHIVSARHGGPAPASLLYLGPNIYNEAGVSRLITIRSDHDGRLIDDPHDAFFAAYLNKNGISAQKLSSCKRPASAQYASHNVLGGSEPEKMSVESVTM